MSNTNNGSIKIKTLYVSRVHERVQYIKKIRKQKLFPPINANYG